jgi:predicted metal-dependent HD superfamily phosphohydrolase
LKDLHQEWKMDPNSRIFERLNGRWLDLMRSFDVEEEAAQRVFNDLVNHYSENGRYYHDLTHIQRILNVVTSHKEQVRDFRSLELAVWFHDVIWEAEALDNEARSAEYAENVLSELGLPSEIAARVSDMIMATTHNFPVEDKDAQILVDADLSPLGADEEDFKKQSRAIRKEFSWIPDDVYKASRVQLMNRFLSRERIFYTEQFYNSYEAQARRNIQREIKVMST